MDRLKTFLIYALCIIGFMIISEGIINVGLNSNYKQIVRKDNISQINVYQAEATKVNGRIRGIITNSEENLNGKFVRIDFYSERNVFLGKKYVEIKNLKENESKPFETYFNMENVYSYELSIVNEKEKQETIMEMIKSLINPEYTVAKTALMLIIL